MMPMRGHLEAS